MQIQAHSSNYEIHSPWDGRVVATVPDSDSTDLEAALNSVERGFQAMRSLAAYERADLLHAVGIALAERREEFAQAICASVGKPIKDARAEVERALVCLRVAATETLRIDGEAIGLDVASNGSGRMGMVKRFPIGPTLAITPFNFPLNLGMHKVAPALASGNSVLWKPSRQCANVAYLFAKICQKVGLPDGALEVVSPTDEVADSLITDPRIRMVSFTGSGRVGWKLRSLATGKKVALELGGNAPVLVASDADLDLAASRCVAGGFSYSGQVCISVQRILVLRDIADQFMTKLVGRVSELRVGDPSDEVTDLGPMVSTKDADRVMSWIDAVRNSNAKILSGGGRDGNMIQPTVIVDAPFYSEIWCEEAFGPVVVVKVVDTWQEAVRLANDSKYGLQAGVFTESLSLAMEAYEGLETGGVIVNDVPTFRVDNMPYGGIKESGLGREGIRYAIQEMTEPRLLVLPSGKPS